MYLSKYGMQLIPRIEDDNIKSVLCEDKIMDLPNLIANNNPHKNFPLSKDTKLFVDNRNKYFISVKPSMTSNKVHNIDVFTKNGSHIIGLSDKAISSTIFTRSTGNVSNTIHLNNNSASTQVKVSL